MKKGFFLTLAMAVMAARCGAQGAPEPVTTPAPAPSPSARAQNSDAVLAGAVLSVELSKSLDTKKCKADDKVEAKTATDLLQHGQIVVPRNTKIVGHVTDAKAHSKTSPGSKVGITFDRMLLKDKREVPLRVTVQAIGRPLQAWNSSAGNVPSADNPNNPMAIPGQRAPVAAVPSSPYPGGRDSSEPPDPLGNKSTVSPLNPTSRGVVGIQGLSLETSGSAATLSSNTGNVHLDSGTQMILRVQ